MVIVDLPTPVREYFDSRNAFDAAAALAQFGDDAFVEDENVERRGRDSIRKWIEETQAKYHPRFEAQAAEQMGDNLVVTTLVSGTFPGSPLSIDHAFVLSGEKISRLVIG
jgi:ketosteroid isomerase-like protein